MYVLRLKSGALYPGATRNLPQRIKAHFGGYACRTTSLDPPMDVVYTEQFETLGQARTRENQLKRWSRAKKEALIQGDLTSLKILSLFVAYYDSCNFTANDSAQVYVSVSSDGGETFRDLLVSEVPFKPAQVTASIQGPAGYMGGYIGITALHGVVWPCWNDNRTGVHQAYTSRIDFWTSVREVLSEYPTAFALAQNYPNPFNPTTVVRYQLPVVSDVKLVVYELLGREVIVLVNERRDAGSYEVKFDGAGLASGVYLYRLQAGDFVLTRKLLLLR